MTENKADQQAMEQSSVESKLGDDNPLNPVPLEKRQHWLTPAMIFGGLEFCVPVLMVGAALATSYSLAATIPILLIAFFGIQWIGNIVNGYMGAKTGLSSSILARCSFGQRQSQIIIAFVVMVACMGWWGIQTEVTGDSICAMLGIDHTAPANFGIRALIITIVGILFAIPSILGFSSMKWTDIVAVPAGLILVVFGIYLGISNAGGVSEIFSYKPSAPTLTFIAAINMILGMNISQWVIAADYTRYAKPTVGDAIKIPLGIIGIGIPLMFVGAVMAVGQGTGDIVQVMVNLGFPFWGFIVLWLSSWTSQLVNNYSMGLSMSTLFGAKTNKGRIILTIIGTIISLILSIGGIMDYFIEFIYLSSLFYAPIAGVMFTDFFLRFGKWEDHKGWNMMATLAIACGIGVGYYTTYVSPMGIPVIQCVLVTAAVYLIATKIKAGVKPDEFTPARFLAK